MGSLDSARARAAVVLICCGSLLLGGCTAGGGGPALEAPPSSRASATGPTPGETCGVDTQAAAIHDNLWQVPAPQAVGEGWEYYGQSNYDPCADLSYALVWVTGSAHPLKQSQLMLFHRGGYLGVGALAPQSMYVADAGPDSVHTRVVDFEAMEREQAPAAEAELHRSDLTFWWNGERVEAVGRIPNQGAVSLPH